MIDLAGLRAALLVQFDSKHIDIAGAARVNRMRRTDRI
jgi:hypothetical protein